MCPVPEQSVQPLCHRRKETRESSKRMKLSGKGGFRSGGLPTVMPTGGDCRKEDFLETAKKSLEEYRKSTQMRRVTFAFESIFKKSQEALIGVALGVRQIKHRRNMQDVFVVSLGLGVCTFHVRIRLDKPE